MQLYSGLLVLSAQCETSNDQPQSPPQITSVLQRLTKPETIIVNEVRVKMPAEAGPVDKHVLTRRGDTLAGER